MTLMEQIAYNALFHKIPWESWQKLNQKLMKKENEYYQLIGEYNDMHELDSISETHSQKDIDDMEDKILHVEQVMDCFHIYKMFKELPVNADGMRKIFVHAEEVFKKHPELLNDIGTLTLDDKEDSDV